MLTVLRKESYPKKTTNYLLLCQEGTWRWRRIWYAHVYIYTLPYAWFYKF